MLAFSVPVWRGVKGEHWYKMIFYQVKKGLILSIFAYFIFVEARFKLTKKQKQSSDLYSLLLLYPAGGNSLFLLHPVGGNSLVHIGAFWNRL